jgi:hypothetical protein
MDLTRGWMRVGGAAQVTRVPQPLPEEANIAATGAAEGQFNMLTVADCVPMYVVVPD